MEKRRFNLIKVGKKQYTLLDSKGNYREYVLEMMNANGIRGRETMIFDISDGISTVSLILIARQAVHRFLQFLFQKESNGKLARRKLQHIRKQETFL